MIAPDPHASLQERYAALEATFATAPVGIAVFDREGRYLRVNEELAAINGVPVEGHTGRRVHEVVPLMGPQVEALIREVFDTGVPVRDLEVSGETSRHPGVQRHWACDFYPVRGAGGAVQAVGAWVREISERKRALQQLHLRDRAIAASDAGVLIFDATQPGLPVTFASPGFERMTGHASGDVLGRDWRFLAGPETDSAHAARLAAAFRSGQPVRLTLRCVRRDGSGFWNDFSLSPVHDPQEGLTHFVAILNDVTAQREAQAALEASRLKLEMGIQAAGLIMAEIDYRSNLNYLSAELARLFELGDGPMTVPRQAIFDRIHPEDRDRYLQGIGRAVDPAGNGHLAIDVRALLPSGKLLWLHIRLQVTFAMVDGRLRPERGICAARDVTAEMVAERKLRAAERLAHAVIEGAGALVYAKDLEGRYILGNQAWRTIMGLGPEQLPTDEQIFGPEVAAQLRANDCRVAQTGEPAILEEPVELRGQKITYRSSKFPLYDDAGRVYAVCGLSTDITDVVEADRRKDAFIATLAHELRNPLAPIRTGLEILRRTATLPPQAARTRDMMERQLTHLVRLVDDLLDVSRINRDKLELRMAPVTVQQVVDHALEASQPALQAAEHRVQVELPPEPMWLEGDLTRLAQVVSNLVNNAAKYTPPGGHIWIAAAREEGLVRLTVRDDGPGIAPEVLPEVFTLFAQGSATMGRAQGGLGIGLWLVKKLVELHHGSVCVESAGAGKGCAFHVRLPARAGPPAPSSSVVPTPL